MECVILFRYSDGGVGFIYEGEETPERMSVFPNRDAAIAFAEASQFLRALGYQIVELDEL